MLNKQKFIITMIFIVLTVLLIYSVYFSFITKDTQLPAQTDSQESTYNNSTVNDTLLDVNNTNTTNKKEWIPTNFTDWSPVWKIVWEERK
jgi:flagellar basal body-associated protein FliL